MYVVQLCKCMGDADSSADKRTPKGYWVELSHFRKLFLLVLVVAVVILLFCFPSKSSDHYALHSRVCLNFLKRGKISTQTRK